MADVFYITTPIYYPNDEPHLGSAYSTIYCDTLARYHRAVGDECTFLTGTDEHGQKIAEAAAAEGLEPKPFTDRMAERFRHNWEALGLTPDRFIRTTDPDHVRAVQHFWQIVYDRGEIEFREYSGLYCIGCETFLTEREMQDGRCVQHPNREPEQRSESNYFFKMSDHFEWWIGELEAHPERIQPDRYRNEVLAMLRDGALGDLCISRPRSRLSWGIPAPFDADFVIYVWCDALINYLTGVGYPEDPAWQRRWAGVHHLLGKDILKSHGVFWPTMLHAAGLPLFNTLRVHGHWMIGGQKISKSVGQLVDALAVKDKYGFEPLRYYLLREMSFGLDGEFSEQALVRRMNADLANDLGNLLHRALSMLERYFDGVVPEPHGSSELGAAAESAAREIDLQMRAFSTQRALAALWELVSATNRYIDHSAPWQLAKQEAKRGELASVLYESLEAVRVVAELLEPFLPATSQRILDQLGSPPRSAPLAEAVRWGQLPPGTRTRKAEPLFPRVELD
jgi:methionyl-tRNA synthetase